MIIGVQDIYYNVRDIDKALRFYTVTLGMKCKHKSEWWASLDCGGVTVGLHWSENQSVPPVPKDSHGAYAGGTLTLRSDDIDADRRTLEAGGAKILGEGDQAWGHVLVFEDLDGNVLKLMRPK